MREVRAIESDLNWRFRAACQGVDPEIFFPEDLVRYPFRQEVPAELRAQRHRVVASAKLICRSCPVRLECLEDGREDYDGGDGRQKFYGIRGGLLPAQRMAYYRRTVETVDAVSG